MFVSDHLIHLTPITQSSPRVQSRPTQQLPIKTAGAQSLCRASFSMRRKQRDWQTLHQRSHKLLARGYKVEIQHEGGVAVLDVDEEDTILQAALDSGLELSHDW